MGRAAGDPWHVVGYRGYGTRARVLVLGRVLQDEGIPPPELESSKWSNLISTLKRIESDPLPYARVRATSGDVSRELVADDEGFLREWITPGTFDGGETWHAVTLELVEPVRGAARLEAVAAPVLIPPATAKLGIISDLDDTVIQSDVANFLRAARTVLLENALTRLPFPGVAAFYRALVAGASGLERNPIFYVSSSPWNVYDVVDGFLDAQGIPAGPLLLRDWDLGPGLATHGEHKEQNITEILELYSSLPFILVGDSTQEDPEIYARIVHRFPARILAVYIRNVNPRPERVERIRNLAKEVEEAGSVLVLADDTLAVATDAAKRGIITASALPDIGEERAADEGDIPGKRESPGTDSPDAPTVVLEP
jgi:phosphatidate phosphatase APP1